MNWSDPVARLQLIESVGPDRYNEMLKQHLDDSVVATFNGYPIRAIGSPRWGRLFQFVDINMAFRTLEECEKHAATLEPK